MTNCKSSQIAIDPLYGVSLPGKWVPAPRYLLRRDRILELLKARQPGDLIEIGCGAGALLYDLTKKGFRCTALDSSAQAIDVATKILEGEPVSILQSVNSDLHQKFDYLLALEVLEHIENDHEALQDWRKFLKPDGKIIISVPAHQSRWGPRDVMAGHYRRYNRDSLSRVIEQAGFKVQHIEYFGFPLAVATTFGINKLHGFRELLGFKSNPDRADATAKSGVDRSIQVRFYPLQQSFIGKLAMRVALTLQNWARDKEWGDGVILVATKIGDPT